MFIAPAASAQEVSGTCKSDFKCTYPENAEGAVQTFSAEDQEGDEIKWSLEGDDAGDFDITGGVLTFKSSPDFESPADKDGNNTYKVTVVATGGKQAVEVKVTDVDEPATVSFTGNAQPQVGNSFQAKVEDPDGDKRTTGNVWRWEKGPDSEEGPWTAIAGAIASSYTPTRADVGNFLRATVTYSDRKFKKKDTQSGVSELAVRARPTSNSAPVFAASAPDEIEVAEEVKGPIGDPIEATDPNNDSLYYELPSEDGDDHDNSRFMISDTGQLSLEKGLNFDVAADSNTDDSSTTGIVEYHVMVRVSDPSGAMAHKTVEVQVTPVDEAPKITGGKDEIKVKETTDLTTTPDAVQITAADATYDTGEDPEADETGDWSVAGDDAGKFDISDGGVLTFKGADADATGYFRPDFEKPGDKDKNNKYQVTVKREFATGGGDVRKSAERAVTVIVENAEDRGTLMLSQLVLHVGRPVRATIDDPDGDTSRESWRWYRNAVDGDGTTIGLLTEPGGAGDLVCEAATTDLCRIATARAANYTPTGDDMGKALAVKAIYRDPVSPGANDDPIFLVTNTVLERKNTNLAPEFRDTNGNPLDSESVTVKENTAAETNIGDAIVAIDDDGEQLLYSLDDGADASHFSIVRTDGQLQTKSKLDYEKPADANKDNAYEVVITATDPSGATDTIPVTITVTNVNEGATISLAGDTGGTPEPTHRCVEGGAVTAAQDANMAADCLTLLEGMEELIGDGTATLNWSDSTPIGEWNGVAQRGTGRVGGIHLAGGSDNLGGGVLAGSIPDSFNTLVALELLTLRNNNLTGELPDLGDLDNLATLDLNSNSLSGSLPASLGDMDEIDYLYLHGNDFSGAIPAELGNATRLRRIHLRNNMLSGAIPSELGGLSRLRNLLLDGNMLSGAIPTELGNLSNLKALYLQDNMLTGGIPTELGSIMTDADDTLRLLYLQNNMLTGDVPASLGNLASLDRLLLSGNMLMGCIPAAIIDAAADAEAAGLMACAADDGNGDDNGDGS
jgi:Leucine-rich repeat (LRR) protein